MNPCQDQAGLTRAQALLSQLPESYFTILKAAQLEEQVGDGVRCTFDIPGIGKRTSSAPSAIEAIRLALIELASILTTTPISSTEAFFGESNTHQVPERFQSKTRQLTVGVTMPTSLKEHLCELAESQGSSFAAISRKLTVIGFEDFEDKSFFIGSQSLFSTLANELGRWQHSEAQQVMVRLEPGQAVRIRSAAKEHNKSASEFGALCMAHGLALEEQFMELEERVLKYKGAAIRPLLSQVGLDAYAAPLLSGVLRGSVRAPKALLKRLASFFETSEEMLMDLFKHAFSNKVMPSFKAENGKPVVPNHPTPWTEAVNAMKLSHEQAKALIDLGD